MLGVFGPRFSRYHMHARQAALVRQAHGYEPRIYGIPDASNVSLIARGNFESRLTIPPLSYICGFSGYSAESAGFRVQIVDLGTQAPFFNQPLLFSAVTPQTQDEGITFPVAYLPRPRIVIEPAVVAVQLSNLATVANTIRFVVWTAEPRQDL